LPDAEFVGGLDWEVSGCTADTRRLDPGQVFIAVRGERLDGHAFVARALRQGAAGVVVERPCPEAGRLQVIVVDSRAAHSRICHALAGDPASRLPVLGITGRTGKAATSAFLRSILEAHGQAVGQVGRSSWSDGTTTRPAGPGTPGPENVAALLAAIAEQGAHGALLEADEATLDRRELDGLPLEAAVVTQVAGAGENPLDPAVTHRRAAFARLFRRIRPDGAAVVNGDDPAAEILGAVNLGAWRVSYGLGKGAHHDVSAVIGRVDAAGTRFQIRGFGRERPVNLRLVGEDHVQHALAAAAVAWSRGIPVETVVEGLEAVTRIPGRLERVEHGQDFEVLVDRAKTVDELNAAFAAIRALGVDRIICVIGAEGEGSSLERAALARAAEAGSSRLILTTDNPRGEDPDAILDDLLAGLRHPGHALVEPDRRTAIARALGDAHPGDAVLIAGKGHHAYQILADRVVPFDDAEVAGTCLRNQGATRISA
jgi:UDP-N-acetylmuramoyl-L-alanyl-D-glutamate--2,6-diaminopimelate ligase